MTTFHAITKAGERHTCGSVAEAQKWLDSKEAPGEVTDYASHRTTTATHRNVRHIWTLQRIEA